MWLKQLSRQINIYYLRYLQVLGTFSLHLDTPLPGSVETLFLSFLREIIPVSQIDGGRIVSVDREVPEWSVV